MCDNRKAIIWKKKGMRIFFVLYWNVKPNWSTEFSYVKYKYLASSEDQSTEKWIVPQNWIRFAKPESFILPNLLWGKITVLRAYDEKEKVKYHWIA